MAKKQNKNKKQKQQIDFKYNTKVFWSFLKKYKFVTIILLLTVLIHEFIIVVDRYLFKVIIDKGTEFTVGTILASVYIKIVIIVAVIFLSATLINIFMRWSEIHLLNRLSTNLITDLKTRYFKHILNLDHKFHTTHKTGSLISRLGRGASSIDRMMDVIIFNFAPLILQLTIVAISFIYFDWLSALVVFITIIVFISVNIYIQKLQEESNLIANKNEDIEKGNIADIFTNIDSIRYFGKEKLINQKYNKLTDTTRKSYIKNWDYFKWLSAIQTLVLAIGTFFIVYFPLIKFLDGQITLGTLAFIYTTFGGLMGPMFSFVHGIRGFYRSMADFQDLFEYGKIEKEILDKPNAKPLEIKQGEIEFKNLNFNYGSRKLFKNFNLKIPKNKKVAFVGHSGCGKTTLVKLLYRLYDIDGGSIIIDNQDIRSVKQESLREEMSIVPQEAILFDDTIYNNVKFSNPKATYKEVMRAMKFAQLDKVIKEFPKKEKTIVGERGVKLSGGEKQRVSIARAILANKKILVLDEATSALDSQTEHEIQEDLKNLMQGRTSLIIAHRLSTIMHADIIVVMKQGKIVQMGKHNQLINQSGEYKHLWELQKGGYIK